MAELPVLPRDPQCPAALAIAGASSSQQGVVCRIMQRSQDTDAGLRMTAGALGVLRDTEGGVYLNLKNDPSSVTGLCHGRALPVLTDEDDQARASYTYCPTWQAHRDRHRAGQRGLFDEAEPESVSMGVSSLDAADPWAQARRDVDLLSSGRY